ncbi:hypothetical protein M408DRAFT_28667 [Serendipita vermifera MAFF 305830]|uniref:Uncharacterized protein n=1 Tax=Serendipita vermifera MAFF 305830 TaxID=933852 RepID=A0A0C3AD23_SERVB|nr:hypothetical protein M408DRAFT_28667 [Serendipita vermifera MAFF 305830]
MLEDGAFNFTILINPNVFDNDGCILVVLFNPFANPSTTRPSTHGSIAISNAASESSVMQVMVGSKPSLAGLFARAEPTNM